MKIKVVQKKINKAMKLVQRILSKKNTNPVLAALYFAVEGEWLTVRVTDLAIGEEIKIKLEEAVTEERKLLVPGKALIEAIGLFSQEETTIELKDEQMILRNGRDRVMIGVLESDDFPDFNLGLEGNGENIPVKLLQEIEEKITLAVSTDVSRPQLTGVYMKFNGEELNLVGTDGFRLSLLDEKNFSLRTEGSILLPARVVKDVLALVEGMEVTKLNIFIQEQKSRVVFLGEGEEFLYFANLIDAAYPPYERIIPLEFAMEVKIDREELLGLLNKAGIFARETSNIVKMKLAEQELSLSAKGLNGQYEGKIELNKPVREDFQIAFNIKYLTDFLSVIKSDEVWWGMNENTKPVLLAAEKGDKYRYIAMPFKATD